MDEIPQWHKEIIDQRVSEYKSYPENAMEIDKVCDDIEIELWNIKLKFFRLLKLIYMRLHFGKKQNKTKGSW